MRPLARPQLHELYYYLALSRKLEDILARMHREAKLDGALWLRPGLEAVALGATFVPTPKDTVSCSLPTVAALVLRGVRSDQILLQVMGKADGASRGRDRSMFFGQVSRGMIAPASHACTHLGVTAGIAWANRYQNNDGVSLTLVSEEAVATGDFHEAVNFAAVHRLPLVVVVVRNEASISSASFPNGTGVPLLFERLQGYGLKAVPVDGSELIAVIQCVDSAFERARRGDGPTVIEANVTLSWRYEFGEHNLPQPFVGSELGNAETREPTDRDMGTDPLRKFERYLKEHDAMTNEEHLQLLTRVDATLAAAVVEAEGAAEPTADDLFGGVYFDTASPVLE